MGLYKTLIGKDLHLTYRYVLWLLF